MPVSMGRPAAPSKLRQPPWDLCSGVDIFQPHNVVLAEIAPDLHLDQFQRDLSRIGQAMRAADWYVERLVFVNNPIVAIERDPGRTMYDDPVLSTMKVLLQR